MQHVPALYSPLTNPQLCFNIVLHQTDLLLFEGVEELDDVSSSADVDEE